MVEKGLNGVAISAAYDGADEGLGTITRHACVHWSMQAGVSGQCEIIRFGGQTGHSETTQW